jgi:DeoR/GlpR family transcriptional regulator of sugar metabolism
VDSFVQFARMRDFERFITDEGLPAEQAVHLHEHGIDVTRA